MRHFLSISFTLFLIFSALVSEAQEFRLVKSKPIDIGKSTKLYKHLYSDESRHYLIYVTEKSRGKEYSAVALDKSYQEIWRKSLGILKKKQVPAGALFLNDKIAWFLKETDAKQKTVQVSLQTVDENGRVSPLKILLKSISAKRKSHIPELIFLTNHNKSHVAAILEYDLDDKVEKMKWEVKVLNDKLEEILSEKITSDHTQRRISVKDVMISNEGNIFFTAKIFNADRSRRYSAYKEGMALDFIYQIIELKINDPILKATEVGIDDILPSGEYLSEDEWGNIIMAGLYSKISAKALQGYYSLKFNPVRSEVSYSEKYLFTESDFEKFQKINLTRGNEKKRGLKEFFTVVGVLPTSNGGHYAIIEEVYKTISKDKTTGTTSTSYHANCLIAIHSNLSGEVDQVELVPKFSTSYDRLRLGHMSLSRGDKVFLIYNDHVKNLQSDYSDLRRYKSVGLRKNTVPVIATLDGETMHREVLVSTKDKREILYPSWTTWVNRHHMIAFMYEEKLGNGFLRMMDIYLD